MKKDKTNKEQKEKKEKKRKPIITEYSVIEKQDKLNAECGMISEGW